MTQVNLFMKSLGFILSNKDVLWLGLQFGDRVDFIFNYQGEMDDKGRSSLS